MVFSKMKKNAFTLIELLVVIAIIALLLSVIVPSLNKAKQLAAAAVCLTNNSQLGHAYYLYAEENNGYLADGKPATTSDGYMNFNVNGRTYRTHCFVAVPMNTAGIFSNTSVEDKIRGFEKGGLWPYLETSGAFNCPADKRWIKPPTSVPATATNAIGGYRSYSLGGVLSADAYSSPETISTGESKAAIIKYSEFTNPGSKIVFLEEADGSGMNVNYWNMFLYEKRWWDPFAIWHNGSSTFGYADGHADRHKWTDKVMIKMSETGEKDRMADVDSSGDYDWFRRAYIPGRLRK